MGFALITVPFVLAAQFFGTIKQSEAVSNRNLVRVVLFTLWRALDVLYVYFLRVLSSLKGFKEAPASLLVEFNDYLKVTLFYIRIIFVIELSLFLFSSSEGLALIGKTIDFRLEIPELVGLYLTVFEKAS